MKINNIKKKLIFVIIKLPRLLKYKFLSNINTIEGKAKFIQPYQINGNGKVIFANNITLGYEPSPYLYSGYGYIEARNINSIIFIGNNVQINNNLVLISEGEGIEIFDNTLIGTNCEIYDSDFHNLSIKNRNNGIVNTKKVIIRENVFIGSNVKILKGVTIGKNSIIANGSIVTNSIPENVIAGGIPAKMIRKI